MEKQWVIFLKEHKQDANSESGAEEMLFSKDMKVELDKSVADSLVTLGFAKTCDAPGDDEGILKEATKQIQTMIEKSVAFAMEGVAKKFEDDIIPHITVTPNAEKDALRGFKDEGHFLKVCLEAQRAAEFGTPINTDRIGGEEYVGYLTKAPSGQNVGTDDEGGFLTLDVMSNRIWDNMENNPASILPKTDRFETTGNSIKVPVMQEVSRKAGVGKRHAGIQVVWLDEAAQIATTKAKVQHQQLELHKLGAIVYFTEEQLDDAPNTWNRRIRELVPEAIMFAVNDSFLRGTGVGQPQGVLNLDSLITIPLQDQQGNHTLFHRNLSNIYWRCWGSQKEWYVHPDAAQQMEFISFNDDTTNQRPIYMPINQGLTTDAANIFRGPYGAQMVVSELASDFASVGDVGLYNWSQYQTLTKVGGGVKTASSIHVRFLFEETAFRFTFRIGGKSFWTTPKEDFQGDTTRSPFVVLASRTGGASSSGI